MNLKNLLTLTIRVEDFNLLALRPGALQKLRKLTLHPHSGMNFELDNFERIRRTRRVECQILLAYRDNELVGWAMMSKEPSDYLFPNAHNGFSPSDGYLFEIYIDPDHRKQGIGTELIKVARRKANGTRLCVCPHDYLSRSFFTNFPNYKNKEL
jgi:GNAT superfamily N-acetyltransferase